MESRILTYCLLNNHGYVYPYNRESANLAWIWQELFRYFLKFVGCTHGTHGASAVESRKARPRRWPFFTRFGGSFKAWWLRFVVNLQARYSVCTVICGSFQLRVFINHRLPLGTKILKGNIMMPYNYTGITFLETSLQSLRHFYKKYWVNVNSS